MIRFDPYLGWPATVGALVVYTALWLVFYQKFRHVLPQPIWWRLTVAKACGVLAVTALLCNPYVETREPDPQTYENVVLADLTGSMGTADCRGQTRLEVLRQLLDPNAAFYGRLFATHPPRFFGFAGEAVRGFSPSADLEVLPGDSDIDEALAFVLDQHGGSKQIGSVLLLSDGQDNVLAPLSAAATAFRDAQIPVHVIGIGERELEADIGIVWKETPGSGVKGKPIALSALVQRSTRGAYETTVELRDGTRVLETKAVRFAPGQKEVEVRFRPVPFVAGFVSYQVRVPKLSERESALNNVDFAGIDVRNPDEFHVLYYGANLNWDYKFLRDLARERKKITLSGVIRTAERTFFVDGLEREGRSSSGFPTQQELSGLECLVIDLRSLYLLDDAEIERLAHFVERRGGGVLFTGHTEDCPERIQRLLPSLEAPERVEAVTEAPLVVHPSQAFADLKARELRQLTEGLAVPDLAHMAPMDAQALKPGAATLAESETPAWTALAVQNYGAGKVGLINVSDTWQWVMTEDRGRQYYAAIWGKLIAWASTGGQDRLTLRPPPGKLLVGRPVPVRIDAMTEAFEPDNSAGLRCDLVRPDGSVERLELFPNVRVDGRYEGRFIPERTGPYRLQVELATGEQPMIRRADYLGVAIGPESQPMPLAEEQLQGVARATGGAYHHYRDANALRQLAVNEAVSFRVEQHFLADRWWWLLAVLLLMLPDWILRRRTGLK